MVVAAVAGAAATTSRISLLLWLRTLLWPSKSASVAQQVRWVAQEQSALPRSSRAALLVCRRSLPMAVARAGSVPRPTSGNGGSINVSPTGASGAVGTFTGVAGAAGAGGNGTTTTTYGTILFGGGGGAGAGTSGAGGGSGRGYITNTAGGSGTAAGGGGGGSVSGPGGAGGGGTTASAGVAPASGYGGGGGGGGPGFTGGKGADGLVVIRWFGPAS